MLMTDLVIYHGAVPWPQIIALVASFAISYLNRPKTNAPKPTAFEEFELPLADVGTSQYVVFGDVWIKDMVVLTYGNFRTTKIKTEGGKKSIGGWTPGLAPGTTNPLEAKFKAPWDPVGDKLTEWDPTQPEEPDDNGLGTGIVGGSTWIP